MTTKEMKKLSRAELLELLLVQTRETERLRKRLDAAEAELADRHLKVEKAGNLAQAVVELNGVMEAAQAAAQQYLDNIARMEEEARQRCEQMVSEARQEAERLLSGTQKTAAPDNTPFEEIYSLLDESNEGIR